MVESTIAAISTALGEGGIAIIRISGPDAVTISTKILTRKNFEIPGKLYLTNLIDNDKNILDRVLAVNFKAPNSYTGEDIVEIHTHGGILIARLCLDLLLKNGAEPARPGEFTRRSFINGRIDLSQAEGVLGIIKSQSIEAIKAGARTLTGELSRKIHKIHDEILNLQSNLEIDLDFPEHENFIEDSNIENEIDIIISKLKNLISQCSAGFLLNNGIKITIAGSPNVGKSSLLNAILGTERAIVTDIPGTTRDIINENILINGLPVRISDTAGLRETENVIEAMGVELAKNSINESDICLYVLDGSTNNVVTPSPQVALFPSMRGRRVSPSQGEMSTQLTERLKNTTIIVLNKSDLEQKIDINSLPHDIPKISVSAKNLTGISELKNLIYDMAVKNSKLSSGLNVSAQQLDDLTESLNLIIEAKNSISDDVRADMLNSARINLLKILGIDAGDELLDNMFSRFCVGK